MPRPGWNRFIDPNPKIIASAIEMEKNKKVNTQIFDDCLCELKFAMPTEIEKNITGINIIFKEDTNISATSSAIYKIESLPLAKGLNLI